MSHTVRDGGVTEVNFAVIIGASCKSLFDVKPPFYGFIGAFCYVPSGKSISTVGGLQLQLLIGIDDECALANIPVWIQWCVLKIFFTLSR